METFDTISIQMSALKADHSMRNRVYRHYKGGEYRVVGVGAESSTGALMVVYQEMGKHLLWVRPLAVFNERVNPTRENLDGVPRFVQIRDKCVQCNQADARDNSSLCAGCWQLELDQARREICPACGRDSLGCSCK